MRAPQIIIIVLYAINLFDELQKHGQPKEGNHRFGVSLLGTAISAAILWWGGFWG